MDDCIADPAPIAHQHGIAPGDVVPVARQGVANRTFFLGRDLVLRIAQSGFEADLRKENQVIPVVRDLGVATPPIVEYDDSHRLVPAAFMVLRRCHGTQPAIPETGEGDALAGIYRQLGEQLAVLHTAGLTVGYEVPVAHPEDPGAELQTLIDRGYLNGDFAGWLRRWLDHLDALRRQYRPVLIHGDAAPHNMLAGAGQLRALLDWGDAQHHDPAVDFAKLPLRALPYAIDGYLSGTTDDERLAWAAGAMWYQLSWAVSRLPSGPDARATHWSAQPANRLLEILRFYTGRLPSGWEALAV